jgi:hypothetical protein
MKQADPFSLRSISLSDGGMPNINHTVDIDDFPSKARALL